jgi:hypothetical protein
MEPCPKIRNGIEAVAAEQEGREILVLHDRTGVSPDLFLDRSAAAVLGLLDGTHTVRDVQVALMRRQGLGFVPLETVERFVRTLDDQFILDNERFEKRWRSLCAQYRAERVRPAAHAGRAYPSDPRELAGQLRGYFQGPDGPPRGGLDATRGTPLGLVLPHIDFHRGGAAYAWGYASLPEADQVDLFVILGTCHLPMVHPFALTAKAFVTPLGEAPAAADLAEAVAREAGMDLFADEMAHRTEHTIEFQVVFLQHLLGPNRPLRILPVLCGGFHEMMAARTLPSGHPPFARGLQALARVLESTSLRTCILASADLAHLGPQFGDPRPVEISDLGRARRQDEAMLAHVLRGDADGFYRSILAEGDRRRICGLPPIYAWLRLLPPGETRLLKYDQAFHPQATVTFASLGRWAPLRKPPDGQETSGCPGL